MFNVESIPPPPGASGMEKRVTRALAGALVVHSTYAPVVLLVPPGVLPLRVTVLLFADTLPAASRART